MIPTHTVTSNGTVTQRYNYISFWRACVGNFNLILPTGFICPTQGGLFMMEK